MSVGERKRLGGCSLCLQVREGRLDVAFIFVGERKMPRACLLCLQVKFTQYPLKGKKLVGLTNFLSFLPVGNWWTYLSQID